MKLCPHHAVLIIILRSCGAGVQEYENQQLALQTLITQQQEMMQELTTAASGHTSADAMAMMLQEVSCDASQPCFCCSARRYCRCTTLCWLLLWMCKRS